MPSVGKLIADMRYEMDCQRIEAEEMASQELLSKDLVEMAYLIQIGETKLLEEDIGGERHNFLEVFIRKGRTRILIATFPNFKG